jgi:hypothetical protein
VKLFFFSNKPHTCSVFLIFNNKVTCPIAPEAGVDAETVENKIILLFHSHHRPWFSTSRYTKRFDYYTDMRLHYSQTQKEFLIIKHKTVNKQHENPKYLQNTGNLLWSKQKAI